MSSPPFAASAAAAAPVRRTDGRLQRLRRCRRLERGERSAGRFDAVVDSGGGGGGGGNQVQIAERGERRLLIFSVWCDHVGMHGERGEGLLRCLSPCPIWAMFPNDMSILKPNKLTFRAPEIQCRDFINLQSFF